MGVGDEGDKSRNRVVAYRRKFQDDAADLTKAAGFKFGNELDFDSFDFDAIAKQFEDLPNIEIASRDARRCSGSWRVGRCGTATRR